MYFVSNFDVTVFGEIDQLANQMLHMRSSGRSGTND